MTTSRPAPSTPVGLRVLATSGLVAVAVVASTYALGSVIGPGGWTGTAVRTVAVLALVTGISPTMTSPGTHRARSGSATPAPSRSPPAMRSATTNTTTAPPTARSAMGRLGSIGATSASVRSRAVESRDRTRSTLERPMRRENRSVGPP